MAVIYIDDQPHEVAPDQNLLQACLGLSFSPNEPRVRIDCPVLPEFMKTVRISNLRVGDAVVDLAFERHQRDVSVNVLRKTGEVEVAVLL